MRRTISDSGGGGTARGGPPLPPGGGTPPPPARPPPPPSDAPPDVVSPPLPHGRSTPGARHHLSDVARVALEERRDLDRVQPLLDRGDQTAVALRQPAEDAIDVEQEIGRGGRHRRLLDGEDTFRTAARALAHAQAVAE